MVKIVLREITINLLDLIAQPIEELQPMRRCLFNRTLQIREGVDLMS